jgi:hypothetical protein
MEPGLQRGSICSGGGSNRERLLRG